MTGPITGIVGHNKPAFTEATARLRAAGYSVLNPQELGHEVIDGEEAWSHYLARDVLAMLGHEPGVEAVQGLAALPGSEGSRGARLEAAIAHRLGWPVATVTEWLELAAAQAVPTGSAAAVAAGEGGAA